jgi:thiol:disulfide interchange protein DsbG
MTHRRCAVLAVPILLMSLSACTTPAATVRTETLMEAHIKTIAPARRAAMAARIEQVAAGIPTGTGSRNKAFVFFDPNCSYCFDLWRETQALRGQVDFVWIPVNMFGDESAALGAAILESADLARIMTANEASLRASGNAITPNPAPSTASLSKVAINTELMLTLDPAAPIQAVPLMVYKSASGRIELVSGSMDASGLRAVLRPDVP